MSGASTPAMSIGLYTWITVSRGRPRLCGPGEGLEVRRSAGVELVARLRGLRWGLLELVQDGPDACRAFFRIMTATTQPSQSQLRPCVPDAHVFSCPKQWA